MRGLDGPALVDTIEMRLVELDDETLSFVWIDADGETVLERMSVPRVLYDETAARTDVYGAVREALTQGPFVDMNRILIDPADREVLPAVVEA